MRCCFRGKVASIVGVLRMRSTSAERSFKNGNNMKQQRKQKHVGCKARWIIQNDETISSPLHLRFIYFPKIAPFFSLQFSLLTIKGINPSPSLRSHSASCLSFWMAAFRHRTSPTYRASVLQPDWLAVKYFDPPKLGSSS